MTEPIIEPKVETPAPGIDMEGFKEEIKAQNASMLNTVLEKINEKKAEAEADPDNFSYDESLAEFEDGLADLRVDSVQGKALLKMFSKILAKENPKVKKEVMSEMRASTKEEKLKEQYETEVTMLYPEIQNKKSALFKKSVDVYATYSDAIKNSPEGTKMAVKEAAIALGIQPMDLNTLRGMNAMGPSGGGAPKADEKISKKAVDFAASFGIKQEKFENKLNAIKAKSR